MANAEKLSTITLPAAADQTNDQFKIVDVNSSGQAVVVSTLGGNAIGVLDVNVTAAGRACTVIIGGAPKALASAAIAAGARLSVAANGQLKTAATGEHVIGRALEAATAANQVIKFLWLKDGISA